MSIPVLPLDERLAMTKETSATMRGIEEQTVKKVVARRAKELGSRVSPRDVTLEFMEADAAPGCRLFHARWGAGEVQGWLSGLIKDEEAPDTYPAQALGKIFRRWIETEGKLPDPTLVATVSAYLYDAADRHNVILNEEEKAQYIRRQEWLRHIRLPTLIEVAGQPGVTFWWVGDGGASEMRVYLAEGGKIRTEETFIQDFLHRARSDS
jgi:hypothetical protein